MYVLEFENLDQVETLLNMILGVVGMVKGEDKNGTTQVRKTLLSQAAQLNDILSNEDVDG